MKSRARRASRPRTHRPGATFWSSPVMRLLGFAALLLPLACSSPERDPDIILITLDTTRADRLGCYGCDFASTPALDAFAAEAVLFESAVTAVPLTLPSHATILTGLNPPSHGARNNASFRVDQEITTLTELLEARGYQCAAFLSAYVLDSQFGLDQGFGTYDDALGGFERSAEATTRRAVAWLDTAGEAPLFLWVHYFDPHTPWKPPEPYASETRGTVYDAEISSMDASLGELLGALRGRGHYDQAHLIIVGDHGEGLGDHREHEHGIFLYEETLRVPLLWRLPGAARIAREDALVGTVDLVPTLCDLLALPGGPIYEGTSLRALLTRGDPLQRDGLYAETMYPYYSYEWSSLEAWRTPELKYIDAPEAELYDLGRDPGERENVIASRAASGQRLREQLEAYRRERGWEAGIPAESSVDPETVAQLTSLGYVWSGGRERTTPGDSLPDPKALIAIHEHFERGKLAALAGRYAEALPDLEATLEAYPDNHAATYMMGVSLVRVGRAAEALPWLERHLAGAPDPNVTLIMGDALLQLERPAEAREWYRRHREQGPQKAIAQERIGDTYLAEERHEDALAAYRALPAEADVVNFARKEARVLVRQGQFAQAAERFDYAAAAAGETDRGHLREWAAYARQLASVGLTAPAEGGDAFRTQIRAAAALGLREESEALVGAVRGRYPEGFLLARRGDVALAEQDWPAAREAYARAEALGERTPDLYLRLSKASLETGDPSGARAALERGVAAGPDPGGLLRYNLACRLARDGVLDEALTILAAACDSGRFAPAAVRADPDLAPLRDLPEFERILGGAGGP